MSKYVLALDQGTSSSRAIVVSAEGRIVASAQREFPQILPAPGIVEHDPEAIWSSQIAVAREAMKRASLTFENLAAVGIANQRETTILWDRATGRPVANAIVWQSRVSAGICERLKAEELEPVFRAKTGLMLDPYFSGTKIAHLLDLHEGLRGSAERGEILFGTVDSWLLWRLTEGRVHATDYSNASRTLLFNIHTLEWDEQLLGILGIPRAMLPNVLPSSHVYGQVADACLGGPVPIAGIAGDQQAAAFGQACFQPASAKNTYGTGCFMLLNTGTRAVPSKNNLLTTIGWGLGREITYCLEGSVFVAGAAVQWLRDGLGILRNSAEVEQLAASVPDSGGVYFVPAFVGLGGAPLGSLCQGHDRGNHTGNHGSPPGTRRDRIHGVPDARPRRRHGAGPRHALGRTQGRRRRGRERRLIAVPGRHHRSRSPPTHHRGDHRARGGLSRRARRGLLGKHGRDRPAVAARSLFPAQH